MKTLHLPPHIQKRLEEVYGEMEKHYNDVASTLQFGCDGCPDNCCDSYFQHHTYIEWCYLWLGINRMAQEVRENVLSRSRDYLVQVELATRRGERPQIMCPLNEGGLCMAYAHRLMVCRTHGVPASITRPDGKSMTFPGCFRCQEKAEKLASPPVMDRTPLLRRLAMLEAELLLNKRHLYPKVRLTIAEMIVRGEPQLPQSCSGPCAE